MQTTRATPPIPELEHPLEEGWTLPATLVHRLRRVRARARAHLRPGVDVRRAGRVGARAGLVLRRAHRSRAGRHRARLGRRSARARQRLPPPRPSRRRGHRLSRDAAVPVPRVDVRPRRDAAPRAALGARARLRPLRPLARARLRRHVGSVRLREPRSRGGAARGSARPTPRDRRRERARRRRDPLPLPPRVADRGELEDRAWRTSSSATTARPRIRGSAR